MIVNATFTVSIPEMGIIMVSGILFPHNLEKYPEVVLTVKEARCSTHPSSGSYNF